MNNFAVERLSLWISPAGDPEILCGTCLFPTVLRHPPTEEKICCKFLSSFGVSIKRQRAAWEKNDFHFAGERKRTALLLYGWTLSCLFLPSEFIFFIVSLAATIVTFLKQFPTDYSKRPLGNCSSNRKDNFGRINEGHLKTKLLALFNLPAGRELWRFGGAV